MHATAITTFAGIGNGDDACLPENYNPVSRANSAETWRQATHRNCVELESFFAQMTGNFELSPSIWRVAEKLSSMFGRVALWTRDVASNDL